jgi:hypothetical protein
METPNPESQPQSPLTTDDLTKIITDFFHQKISQNIFSKEEAATILLDLFVGTINSVEHMLPKEHVDQIAPVLNKQTTTPNTYTEEQIKNMDEEQSLHFLKELGTPILQETQEFLFHRLNTLPEHMPTRLHISLNILNNLLSSFIGTIMPISKEEAVRMVDISKRHLDYCLEYYEKHQPKPE